MALTKVKEKVLLKYRDNPTETNRINYMQLCNMQCATCWRLTVNMGDCYGIKSSACLYHESMVTQEESKFNVFDIVKDMKGVLYCIKNIRGNKCCVVGKDAISRWLPTSSLVAND